MTAGTVVLGKFQAACIPKITVTEGVEDVLQPVMSNAVALCLGMLVTIHVHCT